MSDHNPKSNRIRIMMIEDHTGFREAVALALELEKRFELVASHGSVEGAVLQLVQDSSSEKPDILLLDLHLPGMSGLEGMKEIHQACPSLKVIILTQSRKEVDLLEAIRLGAAGYLLKSSTMEQIKEGILTVSEGGASIESSLAGYILTTLQSKLTDEDTQKAPLTARELDVLNGVAEGLSQKEIAERMKISSYTVADHLKHIYAKLKVQNAPQAIAEAYRKRIFKLK